MDYQKFTENVISVSEGFDAAFAGCIFTSEFLSHKGRIRMALFDELEMCIRPNDDTIVDEETFKNNLVRHIEWIRNSTYYNYEIRDFDYEVANRMIRVAWKFGIEIDSIRK